MARLRSGDRARVGDIGDGISGWPGLCQMYGGMSTIYIELLHTVGFISALTISMLYPLPKLYFVQQEPSVIFFHTIGEFC
jgi:hypothetical protein